jgi:hypothetical protein
MNTTNSTALAGRHERRRHATGRHDAALGLHQIGENDGLVDLLRDWLAVLLHDSPPLAATMHGRRRACHNGMGRLAATFFVVEGLVQSQLMPFRTLAMA